MIQLVTSNYPPLKRKSKTFRDIFNFNITRSQKAVIASGYVSQDSLIELYRFLEVNKKPKIDLIIGMHFFEGITSKQQQIIKNLHSLMSEFDLGNIYFATVSKYHGKVYLFFHDENVPTEVIIGSSNLNSIVSIDLTYETDICISNDPINYEIKDFIFELRDKYCDKYMDIRERLKIKEETLLFRDHQGVKKVSTAELNKIYQQRTDIVITIPLKATEKHQKSNLNACHGKGRENKNTGTILPRPWYEVEIIVPKEITSNPKYPEKQKVFNVYTDDGWKFKCKVNGDYKKNFRSEGDLTILGKWIKGRLENKGVLNVGDVITESTLQSYGRNFFNLIKTKSNDTWILDFGV